MNISEIKDSTAISALRLMKRMGVISYTHFGNVHQFMRKTDYEFSEGLIYVGKEKVAISQYDRLQKAGNDGWFWYQMTYTRYRE